MSRTLYDKLVDAHKVCDLPDGAEQSSKLKSSKTESNRVAEQRATEYQSREQQSRGQQRAAE